MKKNDRLLLFPQYTCHGDYIRSGQQRQISHLIYKKNNFPIFSCRSTDLLERGQSKEYINCDFCIRKMNVQELSSNSSLWIEQNIEKSLKENGCTKYKFIPS